MSELIAVILAAGEGTRMKSAKPKVLHELFGRPMLDYLLETVRQANFKKIIVVVGHQSEEIIKFLSKKGALDKTTEIKTVWQRRLLGSGDAVLQLKPNLKNFAGDLLVLYADTPLISLKTIREMMKQHEKSKSSCTLLSAILKDPTGYGRIVRNEAGEIVKIVEELDADIYEKVLEEINVGVYLFKTKDLFEALEKIKPQNAKAEYYLTDAVGLLAKKGKAIDSLTTQDIREIMGVNTRLDLASAFNNLRIQNGEKWLSQGVSILSPENTFIANNVEIGQDSIIYPFTIIEEDVIIGRNCRVGPFAHLRPGTILEDATEVGNFAELVRSKIGRKTRVRHQSYLGDATVGEAVNIGAGTIVANFDGVKKHETYIEDGAFIGSGTVLVSPVRVGKKAVTGAGCVVTKKKNVPPGATVIGIPAKILEKKKRRNKKPN